MPMRTLHLPFLRIKTCLRRAIPHWLWVGAVGGIVYGAATETTTGVAWAQKKTSKPVYVCIQAPLAALHAKPQTDSRITWQAQQHTPLKVLSRQKKWLWVQDVDGDLHWVAQAWVTQTQRCVVVKGARANIRTHYRRGKQVMTVSKYAAFAETGRRKKWVGVRHHKRTLWVHESLVWPRR